MTDGLLTAHTLNVLTMLSGAVWIGAAVYLQMIFYRQVRASIILVMAGVGAALILLSTALVLPNSPRLAIFLAIVGQIIMLFLGLGSWILIWRKASRGEEINLLAAPW